MTTTRPLVRASVVDDHSTLIHPDGSAEHLVATEGRDLRATVVDRAMQIAASHDTEIELVTSGDLGDVHLLVTPTGRVSQVRVEDSPASLDLELTPHPGGHPRRGDPAARAGAATDVHP